MPFYVVLNDFNLFQKVQSYKKTLFRKLNPFADGENSKTSSNLLTYRNEMFNILIDNLNKS